MINVAVVGTGIISGEHLDAIEHLEEFKLCGLCDVNKERVKPLAEKYNVPFFLDYHDIPKSINIDAVILNLPHYIHMESTVFFLESGINVFVEKPMANTSEECDKMLKAAEKNNRKLAVGHIQRFFKANMEVKRIIESKMLGELCMFNEIRTIDYFLDSRPRWFLEKEKSGGGIVMNYGAHALDKLLYILEMHPKKISASGGNKKNTFNVEGHSQIFLKFHKDISAVITFCGYNYSNYDSIYYFTDGALKVTDSSKLSYLKDGHWVEFDISDDGRSMERQLAEFAKLIRGHKTEIATGLYGKEIISIIETIYNAY